MRIVDSPLRDERRLDPKSSIALPATARILLLPRLSASTARRRPWRREKGGIIGAGNVGSALARGLERAGHEVRPVGNDKAAVRDVAEWADDVILAVPFGAIDDAVREAGDGLDGKTLIDVTNALDGNMNLALGFTTSGAEELQRKVPKAKVVKAFNTVFAKHMDTGRLGDEPLTAFVAGDDADAKQEALTLARDIGFDAVDAGPLKNARLIEPLGYLNIQLGYGQKMGRDIGIDLRRA